MLTGYITEGQIVLDRNLDQTGVYPAVSILPSLSRLMKDGIGEGYTREDHQMVSNQLFAAYAKVQDARSLASVIGEEELSDTDKAYLRYAFESILSIKGFDVNRTIDETLDLGWGFPPCRNQSLIVLTKNIWSIITVPKKLRHFLQRTKIQCRTNNYVGAVTRRDGHFTLHFC